MTVMDAFGPPDCCFCAELIMGQGDRSLGKAGKPQYQPNMSTKYNP
jgi:hypothetical protein